MKPTSRLPAKIQQGVEIRSDGRDVFSSGICDGGVRSHNKVVKGKERGSESSGVQGAGSDRAEEKGAGRAEKAEAWLTVPYRVPWVPLTHKSQLMSGRHGESGVTKGPDPFVLGFTGSEGDPGSNNQKNVWPSRQTDGCGVRRRVSYIREVTYTYLRDSFKALRLETGAAMKQSTGIKVAVLAAMEQPTVLQDMSPARTVTAHHWATPDASSTLGSAHAPMAHDSGVDIDARGDGTVIDIDARGDGTVIVSRRQTLQYKLISYLDVLNMIYTHGQEQRAIFPLPLGSYSDSGVDIDARSDATVIGSDRGLSESRLKARPDGLVISNPRAFSDSDLGARSDRAAANHCI
ncbi:hypothetical protein GGX14DRAFT_389092 [Mycena pura]|uniref:Uncharacterized protein n=1 Tax=Mycena pura TaxID=153505 RepID=A0AAD6VRL9_9AGAR|nr:hypothetical protein GGX14DRAFT_389092 [Mycena pura]